MIHHKTINELYRRYRRRPKDENDLHLNILACVSGNTGVLRREGNEIVFNARETCGKERRISIEHIHGIVSFERHVAIVLCASIIFVNKETGSVSVHIKEEKPSWFDRIRMRLGF